MPIFSSVSAPIITGSIALLIDSIRSYVNTNTNSNIYSSINSNSNSNTIYSIDMILSPASIKQALIHTARKLPNYNMFEQGKYIHVHMHTYCCIYRYIFVYLDAYFCIFMHAYLIIWALYAYTCSGIYTYMYMYIYNY